MLRSGDRVGPWAAANNVEFAYVPFAWRNRHATDPRLRRVIQRASTVKRAKVA